MPSGCCTSPAGTRPGGGRSSTPSCGASPIADYGADPACAPDEARVLRLVPYPNRKLSPEGVPTSLVLERSDRYELPHLLKAFAPPATTTFGAVRPPPLPGAPLPDAEPQTDAAETPSVV